MRDGPTGRPVLRFGPVRCSLVVRFVGMRVAAALVALCAVASAQQMPCEPCAKGDDALSQLPDHGEAIRKARDGLQELRIATVQITTVAASNMRNWSASQPGLDDDVRALGKPTQDQLHDIAAAICEAPDSTCVTY